MSIKETSKFEGDLYLASSSEPTVYGTGSLKLDGNLYVSGNATIVGGVSSLHSSLSGLTNSDDHTQYALLAGRPDGQIYTAGNAANNNLTLRSTSNITKGSVIFDETTATTSNSSGSIKIYGGIAISNNTDSASSINGGTFTTAGGMAIAKKLYIGSDLNISGNIVSGTWNATTVSVLYGGTGAATLNSNSILLGNGVGPIQSPANITYSLNTLNLPKINITDNTATTSNSIGSILIAGSIAISNTSDSISSTSGGTFTTAGGMAVAKKLYVGSDLSISGNITIAGTTNISHSGLSNLTTSDDHNQYAFLAGRSGGQVYTAGTIAGNNMTLRSTSNITKGSVIFDETTVSTSSSIGSVKISGSIAISNTTDSISSANGGTFTTAGGVAIAKKLYVGTDVSIGGNLTLTGTNNISHSSLSNLTTSDDHTQYAFLAGRSGGQVYTAGTLTGNNLTLRSTSNVTKGSVVFDETTATTSNAIGSILISGGIAISNTTDSISSANGGTFTTAGGVAIAKKLYVGTDVSIGGNLTLTGTNNISHSSLSNLTTSDDHTQYAFLAGRSGGQVYTAGTLTGNNLTLRSTSNIAKGSVIFDEITVTTSSSIGSVKVSGGIAISNTTDSISSANGGTFTTAGGVAIAKKLYVGTDVSIGGNLTLTGTNNISHASLSNLTTSDDHTQYAFLAGRSGGQVYTAGTLTGNNLTLRSTSNVTKGSVIFDETTVTTSSSIGSVKVIGGIAISNTTDSISSANGGTFTTAGGVAIAKKLYVGTDVSIGGNLTLTGTNNISHASLSNLTTSDDHTQYAFLTGRIGGQVYTAGNSANNNLTLRSTSNVTKGSIVFDETTATTSNAIGSILVSGGIAISNTTDSISSANGGTFTTAGGVAIAKKLYVGTDVSIGGTITSGTWNASTVAVSYGGTGATTLTSNSVLLGNGIGALQSPGTITYTSSTLSLPKISMTDSTASTSSSIGSFLTSGGISISNTTDSTSSINGGTFTTSGGAAIAKTLYVGGVFNAGNTINMNNTKIINLSTPVNPYDAATKSYVDLSIQGLQGKYSVTAGTTSAGTISSSFQNGSVVDSVTLVTGNRILIKNQVSSVENGIYIVNSTGSPTRSADMASGSTANSAYIFIEQGIINADSGWTCINDVGSALVNTDSLVFTQFSGAGTMVAGIGLTKTGNSFSVNSSQTQITSIGTITSGTWNATNISVLYGGTGVTTLNSNSVLLGNGIGALQSPSTITYTSSTLSLPKISMSDSTASTSSSIGSFLASGGIAISNTTDSISSTNGGTFTTAGGLAIAKKLYVGTDVSIGGNLTLTGTNNISHASLSNLTTSDDHIQYAFLAGRSGGQVYTAGNAASNNLTLRSTTNVTKGSVIFDETTVTTSNAIGSILVSGGIAISNTTDSISSINGGTFTTAGGVAIAKKLYVGTDVSIGGNLTLTGTNNISHASLSNLTTSDDHTQYAFLAGRSGGQVYTAGNAASNNLTLRSTSNVTKGSVIFDETTATTSNAIGSILVSGGIAISNTTDSISSINGGTFTTAGGVAIAKKLYVGTDVSIGGNLTLTGTNNISHASLSNLTTSDDHTQYAFLAGRSGGQVYTAGNAASNNLTLRSTSNVTKGSVIFDETTATTSNSIGSIKVSGGIAISNTTDSVSSTNGGTITTAGGAAITKSLYVGGNLNIGGNAALTSVTSGTWNGSLIGISYGGTGVATLNSNSVLLGNGIGALQSPSTITYTSSTLSLPKITLSDTTASTSSSIGSVLVSGGIAISNTTEATSATNGGTITTAGGVGIGKSLFIAGNLTVGGTFAYTGAVSGAHSALTGLTIGDDHPQYAFLAGRSGGQIYTAGIVANNNLTLRSTTSVLKGSVVLDEITDSTSSITGSFKLSGGMGISSTTDAVSTVNGGTFTSAGGGSFAKQLYVGTNLNSGNINVVNSTASNTVSIDCKSSITNIGKLVFTNTSGTGDFKIYGDAGGSQWQSGAGRSLQMGSTHEIRLIGGRNVLTDIPFLSGSSGTYNTIIQNSSDSVGLRIQANATQTSNLTQWTNNTGTTIYSYVDNVGVFNMSGFSLSSYFQQSSITSPSSPSAGTYRYYTDSADLLFKSKNSSGVVTIYQPITTKGDIATSNGTTQTRLPVGTDYSLLITDSSQANGLRWMKNGYAIITELQTAGTNGGDAVSGSWFIKTLNNIVTNPASLTDISISSNVITLVPNIYCINIISPASNVNSHCCRLYNITNNSVLILGSSSFTNGSGQSSSVANGIVTVTSTITVRVEHQVQSTRNSNGRGTASGFQTEVYTQVNINIIG